MIAHVTAAALASENKSHAHPASVDSIPTSANQEDHVSMATYAGRRLYDMACNTATIVGIELLAAAQGVDFHLEEGFTHRQNLPVFIKHYAKASPIMTKTATLPQTSKTPNSW